MKYMFHLSNQNKNQQSTLIVPYFKCNRAIFLERLFKKRKLRTWRLYSWEGVFTWVTVCVLKTMLNTLHSKFYLRVQFSFQLHIFRLLKSDRKDQFFHVLQPHTHSPHFLIFQQTHKFYSSIMAVDHKITFKNSDTKTLLWFHSHSIYHHLHPQIQLICH